MFVDIICICFDIKHDVFCLGRFCCFLKTILIGIVLSKNHRSHTIFKMQQKTVGNNVSNLLFDSAVIRVHQFKKPRHKTQTHPWSRLSPMLRALLIRLRVSSIGFCRRLRVSAEAAPPVPTPPLSPPFTPVPPPPPPVNPSGLLLCLFGERAPGEYGLLR